MSRRATASSCASLNSAISRSRAARTLATFDLLLGLEFGLVALHVEHLLRGRDVLLDDLPLRLPLDLVALDAGLLRDLGDLAQALGVEDVPLLECGGIGLVERRDRDRFQRQAVARPGRA